MKQKTNTRIIVISLILITVVGIIGLIAINTNIYRSISSSYSPVAKVDGEEISRQDLAARQKEVDYFKKWLDENHTSSNAIPKDVLQTLIDEKVSYDYAEKNTLLPTKDQINETYLKAVASVGTEEQYLKKMSDIQGVGKKEILKRIETELIEEAITKQTHLPFSVWVQQQEKSLKIERSNL